MKISGRAIEEFLRHPDPAIRVAVFFGPDQGMVRERAKRLATASVDDLNDPFGVVDLSDEDLKDDPVRLGDEARSLSFGGGRCLVRVRAADSVVAAALKIYLEAPGDGSMVIVEAGELTPKSTLRGLAEGSDICAAVGCYPDQGADLAQTIRGALSEHAITIERDALDLLMVHLPEDRGVVLQEIDKLALLVGDSGQAGVEDVAACLTDAGAVSLDRIAFACGDGDTARVEDLMRRAFDEGISEIGVLRVVQQHFMRLEWAIDQGGRDAVGKLRPPVFFRDRDRFSRQAGSWGMAGVRRVLHALTEAEIGCKSSGEPASLLCSRALLAAASSAPKGLSRAR